MEFRLTFSVLADEYDGNTCAVRPKSGLTPEELPVLAEGLIDLPLVVRPGEVGKGAAGPGIDLFVQVAERAMNDGASLAAYGTLLWQLVKRVKARQDHTLAVQDPATIGALAVGSDPSNVDRLAGASVMPTVCLTGGGPGMGTDSRDVWVTPVVLQDERVWAIFSSPSGKT